MKHPIEWYERTLENSIDSYTRDREALLRRWTDLSDLLARNEFKAFQIEEAKKEKKDGFDDGLYKKKHRPGCMK